MIFAVGARRSGTNWLQRILTAHPDVATVPSETYLFSIGLQPLWERFHQGVFGSPGVGYIHMDRPALADALREFCDRVFLPFLDAAPGTERLVERTPQHVTSLELIGEIYPDAHVVHIVRDGRDVARSLLSHDWPDAPRTIEAAAEEWRSYVDAGDQAGARLRAYRVVRYEEMLADPKRIVSELYTWLGLETTPEIVEATLLESEVPFNVDANSPKVASGKWRRSFTEEDLAAFMRVAGETLARLGYDDGSALEDPASSKVGAPQPATLLARARGRLGSQLAGIRRSPKPGSGRALPKWQHPVIDAQIMFDQVVAAITTRRVDNLKGMIGPATWVRVVAPDDEWKLRGPAALERLGQTTADDKALSGRQVSGDLHVGVPTSTAVMRFADGNGLRYDRVVAATIVDGEVTGITYYQLP